MKVQTITDKPAGVWKYLVLIFFLSLVILIPYCWLFIKAFTDVSGAFTLKNWSFLYTDTVAKFGNVLPTVWLPLRNSTLFAAGMAVCVLVVATPAAYVVSRTAFPGRRALTKLMIVLDAFPVIALLTAFIFLLNSMNLVNKFIGVLLVKLGMFLPGAVWLMKGFFDHVPWDIEWAGIVDGASRFKTFLLIVVPAIKPGLAVILMSAFLSGWGEFILINMFIYGGAQTVSGYIGMMLTVEGSAALPVGVMAAACVFYVIPIIIVFAFSQKTLLKVSQGGSKQL